MSDILIVIGAMVVSMLSGFIAIPVILNYCKDKRLYDLPNGRKVHKSPVPRLGGISFMPSMLIAFCFAIFLLGHESGSRTIQISLWSIYFLISLLLIYFTGIIDDLIGLGAKVKFAVQIIAATLLPLAGLYLNTLNGLFGIYTLPTWAGIPLTILIIVFVCNAMNLIDGIDGLCASLSLYALLGFLYLFYTESLFLYCVLIAGLMGVIIAFLYFNLFGKAGSNRKIFMGDSGSLTLGFILSFLFVKISMDNPNVMDYNPDNMAFAYSLLVVPAFDVVRVVVCRLSRHRSIFQADKNHIHHKLMRMGLSMHQSLIAILAIALCFLLVNIPLYRGLGINVMFIADIVLYAALFFCIDRRIMRKTLKRRHL